MELAAIHGMPVCKSLAERLAVKKMKLGQVGISNSALCGRVGNSMHFTCVGCSLVAIVLLTQPI